MKALTNIAIPLVGDNSPILVRNLASNATNKFETKISVKRAVKAGKRFTLFISNEDMNIIHLLKSLEDSNVLIDDITEIVKHKKQQQQEQQGRFRFLLALLAPLAASLVQPVISLVVKSVSRKGIEKGRKWIFQ